MVLISASAALADDWADCNQAADRDRSIRGCTNIIAAGRESSENLAVAYNNRAATSAPMRLC
jgi:hypothetical protein